MGARLRHWLTGLLAGLFALAILVAPAQNARSVLERTAFLLAYALPDGSLPESAPVPATTATGTARTCWCRPVLPAC